MYLFSAYKSYVHKFLICRRLNAQFNVGIRMREVHKELGGETAS
jgi:hypothetical protein